MHSIIWHPANFSPGFSLVSLSRRNQGLLVAFDTRSLQLRPQGPACFFIWQREEVFFKFFIWKQVKILWVGKSDEILIIFEGFGNQVEVIIVWTFYTTFFPQYTIFNTGSLIKGSVKLFQQNCFFFSNKY